MNRAIILLTALAVTASAAHAEEVSVDVAGIGSRPCSYWLSSRDRKLEGTVWIYGFWSGLNYVAASSQQDQSKTNGVAIIAAVEAVCREKPSQILAEAAWTAYIGSNQK